MADEWTTATLGQLCELRAGSGFRPAFQGKRSEEFPFLKVSDMNLPANAVRIQEANNWVSSDDVRHLGAKPLPPGTVVFAKIGEALRQNRLRQVARETIIDNNMMGAVPRVELVDALYFYYALSRFDFSDVAQGTALPYLTVASLSELTIQLPPLDEQRAIAHVLDTLDNRIELNRRMSETLEAMARALFKSWFVDGCNEAVESDLRSGWRSGAFSDVVEHLRDPVNPLEHANVEFRHFSIPAFDEGRSPKAEFGASIKSLKWRVPANSLLVSKLNPEIERVWLPDVQPDDTAVCSTEFLVLRARRGFSRFFAYCLARSPLFRQHIEALVTGTSKSHQRAPVDAIMSLTVAIPPLQLVRDFDRHAAEWLKRGSLAAAESRTLAALRDTLLPKLISGELRVKDAEKIAARAL